MESVKSRCYVCLNYNDQVLTLNSYDNENNQWITKLQNVVPEVDWSEDYKICTSCTAQLDIAYEFRILCIKLEENRQKLSVVKFEASPILYTCYHCNASFISKEILTEHFVTCSSAPEPPKTEAPLLSKFECDHCSKIFTSQRALKAHVYYCVTGTKPAAKKTTNKKHTSFTCEVCNQIFPQARSVVDHCVTEHSMEKKSVKPYSCDECTMRFSSSTNLIQHKKYHKGSRSHVCSFCGKSYITKSDLTVHEYTHFNRRNYKCEICGKAFNTNKNLCSHKLVVHTDSSLWKYYCEICDRRFPLKSGYDQHMKRHAGDKEFVCHICSKPFVSRSELQKHMSFHSKVKPFKCSHCDKSYKERRVYEVHLAKAHGIGDAKIPIRVRKHVCEICSSAFFDKQKLERHLRTHSGVKPYECCKCDKKFTDKYYLKQHLKNVHGVEESDEADFKYDDANKMVSTVVEWSRNTLFK